MRALYHISFIQIAALVLSPAAAAAPIISIVDPLAGANFWQFCLILGGAFIGGLILNIMPCVLPVLALKLNAMSQPAAALPTAALPPRAQHGWLILGIFAAFILFALLVYGLQRMGQQVGWGFHFQQPIFVLFMMSVLLLFAFLQMGWLSFASTSALQAAADRPLRWVSPSRPLFHLCYGGLIVLLATPCTAPFLGSAVAFALTQSLAMIVAIFLMIALGLAVPWFILFLLPRLADRMIASARAGRAAIVIQYLSAAMLYGAVLWLLWVLAAQLGWPAALSLFAVLHIALGLKGFRLATPAASAAAIALVIVSPLALPMRPEAARLMSSAQPDALIWHAFDINALHRQTEMGKIVFVDIGAEWCLTCQYNKANVLSDREVRQRLRRADIYLMYGDLTTPNPAIADFLKKQNRVGIPFNAIYYRGGKKIFSEILDKEVLLASLN